MRIVHFSDWHGEQFGLPEADLYVCTGDMLDNFPEIEWMDDGFGGTAMADWPKIKPKVEARKQSDWIHNFVKHDGGFLPLLGSPGAPLVVVRGNHDFVDLAPMFKGCNLVHEFKNDNSSVEVLGLTVAGHRGIPYIYGGWSDEVFREDLQSRLRDLPFADLFVTHYPPEGVLDHTYGLENMYHIIMSKVKHVDEVERRLYGAHLFGHIHECGGQTMDVDGFIFSNAATTVNVIDL